MAIEFTGPERVWVAAALRLALLEPAVNGSYFAEKYIKPALKKVESDAAVG